MIVHLGLRIFYCTSHSGPPLGQHPKGVSKGTQTRHDNDDEDNSNDNNNNDNHNDSNNDKNGDMTRVIDFTGKCIPKPSG